MSGQPGEIFNMIKIVKRQQPTKYALMMLNAYFTGICFRPGQSEITWTFRGSKFKLQNRWQNIKIANFNLMKRRLAAR
jgi:hypothetical protein